MPSFDSWPKQLNAMTEPLRRAGFHYTGEGDRVQCHACKVILHRWNVEGFHPALAHLIWSPDCPYLCDVRLEIPRLLDAAQQINRGIGDVGIYNLADGAQLILSLPVPWRPENPIAPDIPEENYDPDIHCCVCMDAEKDVEFLPCGHAVTCYCCAKALQEYQPSPRSPMSCCVCRCQVRALRPTNLT